MIKRNILEIGTVRARVLAACSWVVGLLMSLSFSSCLDEHPKDQLDADKIYGTPSDIYVNAVASLYNHAYQEKSSNARPELAAHIENLDDYDYIFVGYPNWNADLPMPLYTFFEEYDFSGKTIIPFVTHGGSGFSGTIQTIRSLEPDATVLDAGLSVSRNSAAGAQADVKAWTDSLLAD